MVMNKNRQSQGFSLVELLVAMVVGLVIVSGAFALHSGTRKTQLKNEEQMDMVADARFAIEMIAYDLRHSGLWGGTNRASLIACKSSDTGCVQSSAGESLPTSITGDCSVGWHYNLDRPVFGVTSGVTAYTNCLTNRSINTDMLAIRYADAGPLPGALDDGQVYIRSNFVNGRVFVGNTQPVLNTSDSDPMTRNYSLNAHLYYIASFTDSSGDGIPSLRRMALVNGPEVEDQLLVSGVYDLQVAFGEDVTGDSIVDHYTDPSLVTDWDNIFAAKIWLVMRTDKKQGNVQKTKTFTIDGVTKNYGGDGFRYFMVSTVVNFRN
jgi:type IV pilus assembly protein PilW